MKSCPGCGISFEEFLRGHVAGTIRQRRDLVRLETYWEHDGCCGWTVTDQEAEMANMGDYRYNISWQTTANTSATTGVYYPNNTYVGVPYNGITTTPNFGPFNTPAGSVVPLPMPETEEDAMGWLKRRVAEVCEEAWAA